MVAALAEMHSCTHLLPGDTILQSNACQGLQSVSQCCSFHNGPSSLLPMGRSDARPSAGSVRQSPLRLSVSLQGMNWRHSVARSMSAPTGFSQWAEAMLALEENRWGNFQCDHQFVDLTSYASSRYILHTRAAAVERSVIVSLDMHCHSENNRDCAVWVKCFCFFSPVSLAVVECSVQASLMYARTRPVFMMDLHV